MRENKKKRRRGLRLHPGGGSPVGHHRRVEPPAHGRRTVPGLHCGGPELRRHGITGCGICREGPVRLPCSAGPSEILLRHRCHQRGAVHPVLLHLPEALLAGGGLHPAVHGALLRGGAVGDFVEGARDTAEAGSPGADIGGLRPGLRRFCRRPDGHCTRHFAGAGGRLLLCPVQHFRPLRPGSL